MPDTLRCDVNAVMGFTFSLGLCAHSDLLQKMAFALLHIVPASLNTQVLNLLIQTLMECK